MTDSITRRRLGDKLRPLRDPAFRGIYIGNLCSSATDGIIPVAFAVYSIQAFGSAAALTTILITLWVGRFACTPIAGSFAARYDRFTIMISSDLARIVAQGGLALAIVMTERDSLLAMAASAGLYGAATAFYGPALYTVLPQVVPERGLRTANALIAMVADISVLVGPAIAVVLLETVGFVWILVFDSITFAVNMLALLYVRRICASASGVQGDSGPGDHDQSADRRQSLRSILADDPWLAWSVTLWFVVSFAIGMVAVAGPTMTVARTGDGGQWAALATGMAAAGLVGSLALVAGLRQLTWSIAVAAMGFAIVLELLAVASYAQGVTGVPTLFTGCMLAGFAISVAGIVWQTLIQTRLTTASLGRFSSFEGFVNAAGIPVGMAAGGLALSTIGIEVAVVLTIVATILLALVVRSTVGSLGSGRTDSRTSRSGKESG